MGFQQETFTYTFSTGINYFKGKNNSGKTVFYNFIDYMLGDSQDISKKTWFKNSLDYSILEFEYNNISYLVKRTLDKEINFFKYKEDPTWGVEIGLGEYKEKINSIFGYNIRALNDLREFTDENLTYRSFTIFNFLDEKSLGNINDFFSKSTDIKYSTKLPSILNYIFNQHLKEIADLKDQLNKSIKEANQIEKSITRFDFIKDKINFNLARLNVPVNYTGKNKDIILNELDTIKKLEESKRKKNKEKSITELESVFNNLSEQLKDYQSSVDDSKQFEKENTNRKILLKTLYDLISNNENYNYLVNPLIKMLNDLDKRISFNKHIITNHTINDIRKQKEEIRKEIHEHDLRFTTYTISEKSKFIAVVEEYLGIDVNFDAKRLENLKKKIKTIKEEIRTLQNSNNEEKIKSLSNFITKLYKSAAESSDIIKSDENLEGFYIQYYKKGNSLQPMILNQNKNSSDQELEKYYIGSMARHTLIQFCGYLGFLYLLTREQRYPLVPILVVDHLSKPFDQSNKKAIGKILKTFYQHISKEELQIFLFDDEEHKNLLIDPDHSEDLVSSNKRGFNPFFYETK